MFWRGQKPSHGTYKIAKSFPPPLYSCPARYPFLEQKLLKAQNHFQDQKHSWQWQQYEIAYLVILFLYNYISS